MEPYHKGSIKIKSFKNNKITSPHISPTYNHPQLNY